MRAACAKALLAASLLAAAGCGRLGPQPQPKQAGGERPAAESVQAWTPERITRDPGGYLACADAEIARQIGERESRIVQVEASRQTLGGRADKLRQELRDAANIQRRLQAASARADEDDAWPITFAGQKLERAKAASVAAASQRFVQSRTPLAGEYDRALERVDAAVQSLRSDIAELGQLREKLALDMERVRLNQGIAEVAELRKSVESLKGFATSLADNTDNPLEELAEKARPLAAEAELESLLGK